MIDPSLALAPGEALAGSLLADEYWSRLMGTGDVERPSAPFWLYRSIMQMALSYAHSPSSRAEEDIQTILENHEACLLVPVMLYSTSFVKSPLEEVSAKKPLHPISTPTKRSGTIRISASPTLTLTLNAPRSTPAREVSIAPLFGNDLGLVQHVSSLQRNCETVLLSNEGAALEVAFCNVRISNYQPAMLVRILSRLIKRWRERVTRQPHRSFDSVHDYALMGDLGALFRHAYYEIDCDNSIANCNFSLANVLQLVHYRALFSPRYVEEVFRSLFRGTYRGALEYNLAPYRDSQPDQDAERAHQATYRLALVICNWLPNGKDILEMFAATSLPRAGVLYAAAQKSALKHICDRQVTAAETKRSPVETARDNEDETDSASETAKNRQEILLQILVSPDGDALDKSQLVYSEYADPEVLELRMPDAFQKLKAMHRRRSSSQSPLLSDSFVVTIVDGDLFEGLLLCKRSIHAILYNVLKEQVPPWNIFEPLYRNDSDFQLREPDTPYSIAKTAAILHAIGYCDSAVWRALEQSLAEFLVRRSLRLPAPGSASIPANGEYLPLYVDGEGSALESIKQQQTLSGLMRSTFALLSRLSMHRPVLRPALEYTSKLYLQWRISQKILVDRYSSETPIERFPFSAAQKMTPDDDGDDDNNDRGPMSTVAPAYSSSSISNGTGLTERLDDDDGDLEEPQFVSSNLNAKVFS